MAVTDFKYASQSDLNYYYPTYSQFDTKRQILGFKTTDTSNQYQAFNTGKIDQLYFDGIEGTSVSDDPNANYEYNYSETTDSVQVFNSSANPNDMVIEAGVDNATYFDQMLVNASMELNNYLDARFATPIPKYTQYDADSTVASATVEYDAIIIKTTCYICVANLLRTNNRQEEADYYHSLVTNVEGTGMIDRLNKGEYKLSFEVDEKDSKGKPRTITKTGSMELVETAGDYYGEPFDILRITCTTAGAYGVAKVKVEYYGSDKLFGSTDTDNIVTGSLDEYGGMGGLQVRFSGSSMAVNDQWTIEVYSKHRKITNASSNSVELTRRSYGI